MKKMVNHPLPRIRMDVVDSFVQDMTYEEIVEYYPRWRDEVHANQHRVRSYLNKFNLPDLNRGQFQEILKNLWTVKHSHRSLESIMAEILEHGMLPVIKAFSLLLYGNQPLPERFDYVESRIRPLGESGISEILWLHDRTEYPLWTRFSREGLVFLGIFEEFQRRVSKKKSKGEKYVVVCDFARGILSQIQAKHQTFNDFMALDLVLYLVESEGRIYPEQ
jgi:hypothetical protein